MTMCAELVLRLEQEVLIGGEKRIIGKFQCLYEFAESPGHCESILDVPDRRAGIGDVVVIVIKLIVLDVALERRQRDRAGKVIARHPDEVDFERQDRMERV